MSDVRFGLPSLQIVFSGSGCLQSLTFTLHRFTSFIWNLQKLSFSLKNAMALSPKNVVKHFQVPVINKDYNFIAI